MGSFSVKRSSQTGIHSKTSFYRSSANKFQYSKRSYFTVGGRKIVAKRCNRTCPSRRNKNRFLFNIFCSPKENGRLETNHKSETSEQVSKETAFQNGTSKQSHKPSTTKRLGNFNRSDRCLSTYTQPCKMQKIPTFYIQGKAYQFTCLCFGPTLAPRTLTKIVSVIAAHLRLQSVRLAVYLDDCFLINQLKKLLLMDKEKALNFLVRLGLMIRLEKSALVQVKE